MEITSYACVAINELGRPFRAGLRLRIAPRAKAPGLFCFPPSGEGRPPAYLNAYRQLPDIESRLKRPRRLKRMRMALKHSYMLMGARPPSASPSRILFASKLCKGERAYELSQTWQSWRESKRTIARIMGYVR